MCSSLRQLDVSVIGSISFSYSSHAHLRAINYRKRGEQRTSLDNQSETITKKYLATFFFFNHVRYNFFFFNRIYVLFMLKLTVVIWGKNSYHISFAYMLHIFTSQGHDKHDLKDVPFRHHKMRESKVQDSLLWRRQKNQNMSSKGAGLISFAVFSLNRFANDGISYAVLFDSRIMIMLVLLREMWRQN